MKPLLLIPALFIALFNYAQPNFTKAVLFKDDGTRVDCYIKNSAYEGTQQVFEYSLEKGGKTIAVDAKALSKIEFVDGMVLEKHFIRITSMNIAILDRRLVDYESPANKVNNFFMVERVINGTYSLYQFIDKYSFSHFFYKTSRDSVIQSLEYKEYVDENATVVNKREFRNELLFLATSAGCDKKLSEIIERTEYRLRHMIAVFKKLNACAGESVVVTNKFITSRSTLRLAVDGGMAATSLSTPIPNEYSYPGLTRDAFSSRISPLFGFSVELTPPARRKNYLVSLDLLYHSYSATTDSLHAASYLTSIGKIKFSAYSFTPVFKYRLAQKRVSPFVEAGPSIRVLTKNGDEYYTRNSISGVTTKEPIFTGKSTAFAVMLGAGLELKRFSLHARYSFPVQHSVTHYSTIFIMGKVVLFGK